MIIFFNLCSNMNAYPGRFPTEEWSQAARPGERMTTNGADSDCDKSFTLLQQKCKNICN